MVIIAKGDSKCDGHLSLHWDFLMNTRSVGKFPVHRRNMYSTHQKPVFLSYLRVSSALPLLLCPLQRKADRKSEGAEKAKSAEVGPASSAAPESSEPDESQARQGAAKPAKRRMVRIPTLGRSDLFLTVC